MLDNKENTNDFQKIFPTALLAGVITRRVGTPEDLLVAWWNPGMIISIFYYLIISPSLDSQDAAAPKFDYSNVVFDLFIETRCFAFNFTLCNFSKRF